MRERALVRVFVPTYRRPAFLQRAIASLCAQTFTDWICEVHNDDPNDGYPAELIAKLADGRFEFHQHQHNLGAIATFNLFYRPAREPFSALLEDDNWWEPDFLSVMQSELERHPDVTLAWCNQKIWEELADRTWRDTGECVNPLENILSRQIEFGSQKQILGSLHGHGAALFRSRPNNTYETPMDWPLAAIEPLRERMMPHPLLYVPQPLAVFAKTLRTARSESRTEWATAQAMLAATFIKHAHYDDAHLAEVFTQGRSEKPSHSSSLLLAALLEPSCRSLLKHSKFFDWLLMLRSLFRRPLLHWRVFRARRHHADWWDLLDHHTETRFEELHSNQRRQRKLSDTRIARGLS